MTIRYLLKTMFRQTIAVRFVLTALAAALLLLMATALFNRAEIARTTRTYEYEISRLESRLSGLRDDYLIQHRNVTRIEALSGRVRRLSEKELANAKFNRDRLQDEIDLLDAVKSLDVRILAAMANPSERLDLEIERGALLLDKAGMTDEPVSAVGVSFDDPLYFIFLTEPRAQLQAKQAYYQAVRLLESESSVPPQQAFPERNGWTGAKALSRLTSAPASYLFMALTALFPSVWLAGLFERRLTKNYLMAATRRRFFIAAAGAAVIFWLAAVLLTGIFVFALHTAVNGIGSFRHIDMQHGLTATYAANLSTGAPSLVLFSLQLLACLSLLGVLTASMTAPPLILMLLIIFHAVPSYFGRVGSPNHPLAFFDSFGGGAIRRDAAGVWLLLTAGLFMYVLYRRIRRYQLAD